MLKYGESGAGVAGSAAAQQDWPRYLAQFHAERPGITEDVLERACDPSGRTPYDWLAQALDTAAPLQRGSADPVRVLDLACGSAPMAARLPDRSYLGADLSPAELRRARARGVPVLQADAGRLPLPDDSVDAVVMSMALMLVPLQATLREVRRVLRPDGVFAATVPHSRPMPARDRLRYGRLLLALRRPGLSYPNDEPLRNAHSAFAAAGLTLQQDTAVAFACHMPTTAVAEQLLASLYLPDVKPGRLTAGKQVVQRWAGTSITTPIRLLVATAAHATPPARARAGPTAGAVGAGVGVRRR